MRANDSSTADDLMRIFIRLEKTFVSYNRNSFKHDLENYSSRDQLTVSSIRIIAKYIYQDRYLDDNKPFDPHLYRPFTFPSGHFHTALLQSLVYPFIIEPVIF